MNTMNQNLTRLKNRLQTLSWEPWLLVASGVFMAHISWLKWPDLVIDFGEQAYIAWRLSEGAVLYKDIVYFYGPLSSTIHAFLFKLFGPQLMVLIVFNLILVAALTVVIYKLFLFTGSRLSATMAGLTFLIVFAFAQYLWMGNHNFICSYVYDVTHGIFLSFLAAGQYLMFAKSREPSKLLLLGLLSGLVLLTKIEVSLAWTTAVFAGLFLLFKTWNLTFREWSKYWALFCLGLFLPFLMFTFYFAYHMGWSQGLQAMLSPWTYVFSTAIGSLAFYSGDFGSPQSCTAQTCGTIPIIGNTGDHSVSPGTANFSIAHPLVGIIATSALYHVGCRCCFMFSAVERRQGFGGSRSQPCVGRSHHICNGSFIKNIF